jgi:hypothetical protein
MAKFILHLVDDVVCVAISRCDRQGSMIRLPMDRDSATRAQPSGASIKATVTGLREAVAAAVGVLHAPHRPALVHRPPHPWGDLDRLIQFIAKHYRFDPDVYPFLTGADEKARLEFALTHSALHFAKTAGQVAAVSEAADHSGVLDIDQLRAVVPKALINVLRLAQLVDLSQEDLVLAVERQYGASIDSDGASSQATEQVA